MKVRKFVVTCLRNLNGAQLEVTVIDVIPTRSTGSSKSIVSTYLPRTVTSYFAGVSAAGYKIEIGVAMPV